uniref:Putative cytochrome P450 n=1 Tax=Puccinia horiana TaxID=331382 RepID=W8FTD3_9BASI|nr:putative cytochrome P450 [Puccinia horiana]
MAGNIMSGGLRTLCLPYGDRWKRFRRYQPIQERASRQLILDIVERPKDFTEALTRYAASVIIKITYGKLTPIHHGDEEVVQVIKTLRRFTKAARLGAHSVDRFPWLRYIPGWVAQGRKWHQEELQLFSSQVEGVRREINIPGKRDSCFTSYMLERQKEFSLSDSEAAYLAGSLFGAGSDTTAAALAVVIFAAACHPEESKRVQDELDSVVGDGRKLPFVTAFVCETFRWRPVSAAGFMHATVKDDVYEGHFIPAGSWVIGNHWSIHRDESVFPEPEKFDLSRWLTIDEKSGKTILRPDMRHFAYGFGRRNIKVTNHQ